MMNLSIIFSLLLTLFFFFFSLSSSSPPVTDRFLISSSTTISNTTDPQQYFDPTFPPPPDSPPLCSLPLLLNHSFADTYGLPPVTVPYTPSLLHPNCSSPWSRVVLRLSVSSSGDQYDRIAAVWLGGVELLRTSTAEPTATGIFWTVRKDVTRYRSLLLNPGNVSMMLENLITDQLIGVYRCDLSLEFYPQAAADDGGSNSSRRIATELSHIALPSANMNSSAYDDAPAHLILPVSNASPETGHWFRMQNGSISSCSRNVTIPRNTYKAVLELYVSFHGNDEFFYSNPPDSYIQQNNLTTGRGNGPFRQVFATIDGRLVGSVLPFPVIFTGGINPLFWAPVVAIGAFDLPTYNLDVTPFLALLLDGEPHEVGLNVTDGISFWLLDANLHLWLDPESSSVEAGLMQYVAPPVFVARSYKFFHLNGTFKTDTTVKVHFAGWVNSSFGNLTTDVNLKVKFKHLMLFSNDGNYKEVHSKVKGKLAVMVVKDKGGLLSMISRKYKYPLMVITSNLAQENNTYRMTTNVSHSLSDEGAHQYAGKVIRSYSFSAKQDANGWMLVQDHSVLSGSAETQQAYEYKGSDACYDRKVSTMDGNILKDSITDDCPPPPT